jgi:hypothetical protein
MGRACWIAICVFIACGALVFILRPVARESIQRHESARVEIPLKMRRGTAKISGVLRFEGTPPARRQINLSYSSDCKAIYGDRPLFKEDIIVSDGRLKNVLVYVKSGAENWVGPEPTDPVRMGIKDCVYVPHVVVVRVDQPFEMISYDDFPHNFHVLSGDNPEFCAPPRSAGINPTTRFSNPQIGGEVVCNIHNWMKGIIHVLPHPFFAVTGDDGSFTIQDLPPGEYEIEAWHESDKLDGPHSRRVRVSDCEAIRDFDFTFGMKAR